MAALLAPQCVVTLVRGLVLQSLCCWKPERQTCPEQGERTVGVSMSRKKGPVCWCYASRNVVSAPCYTKHSMPNDRAPDRGVGMLDTCRPKINNLSRTPTGQPCRLGLINGLEKAHPIPSHDRSSSPKPFIDPSHE
ncbi:hypothetical protein F4780DRAFT_750468 [Xylariomycetidae sp. FL0641]|nr:hypothetical protein F4780DRAFT_750468 [Xylariomycetidae sp. FL0641]